MSVIDLTMPAVTQTVSLPAAPQGVAVGGDGRALITVSGTSTTTYINSPRDLYDRTAATDDNS